MIFNLHKSMQRSINQLDSFLDAWTFGTLIIENEQIKLATESSEFLLDDSYLIEVKNGNKYMPISMSQALNTCDSVTQWQLFAGLDARVKLKAIKEKATGGNQ